MIFLKILFNSIINFIILKKKKIDKESYFQNAKGLWLWTKDFEVENPKALVFLSHGYGEYSTRAGYLNVIQELNKIGCNVYCIDVNFLIFFFLFDFAILSKMFNIKIKILASRSWKKVMIHSFNFLFLFFFLN